MSGETDDLTEEERALSKRIGEALDNYTGPEYEWDGIDEDERPLTEEEYDAGIESAKAMNFPRIMKIRSMPPTPGRDK